MAPGKHHKFNSQSKPSTGQDTFPRDDPNSAYYQGHTDYIADPRQNRISEAQIRNQLSANGVPFPRTTGKSGYPHSFENKEHIACLIASLSRESSSTSHYEYPIFANDHYYDFDSKPKERPGNLRAITNQNGRLKTVLAHNGSIVHGVPGPSFGDFHECAREEAKQEPHQKSDDQSGKSSWRMKK